MGTFHSNHHTDNKVMFISFIPHHPTHILNMLPIAVIKTTDKSKLGKKEERALFGLHVLITVYHRENPMAGTQAETTEKCGFP